MSSPIHQSEISDEADVDGPQEFILRSTSLWLDDGNIILQAQNTQFRVHKSVLAMHSNVFKEILSIPQAQNETVVDGCPVVQLPESAQHVEHFLNRLYNRPFRPQMLELVELEAFLRLGLKYEVYDLQQEALNCFRTTFPTTLQEWSQRAENRTMAVQEGSDLLKIYQLVHEFRLFQHLPALYFTIATSMSFEQLYENIPHVLLPDNALQITLIIEKFRTAQRVDAYSWMKTLHTGTCYYREYGHEDTDCRSIGLYMAEKFFSELNDSPSGMLVSDLRDEWHDCCQDCLCGSCHASAKNAHERYRSQFWEKLPEYCGLSGWDDLTNFE